MGLDVFVATNVRRVGDFPPENDADWDRYVPVYTTDGGPNRQDDKATGMYDCDDRPVAFAAGSYSGYNIWRELLSEFGMGVAPEKVWRDPEQFEGKPFVEQVNYADNEGAIGPATAAKLAKDYDDHADRVGEWARGRQQEREIGGDADWSDWFVDLYGQWREAFHAAAENDGVVIFG